MVYREGKLRIIQIIYVATIMYYSKIGAWICTIIECVVKLSHINVYRVVVHLVL